MAADPLTFYGCGGPSFVSDTRIDGGIRLLSSDFVVANQRRDRLPMYNHHPGSH